MLGIFLQCKSWHMYIPLHSVPIKVCPIFYADVAMWDPQCIEGAVGTSFMPKVNLVMLTSIVDEK